MRIRRGLKLCAGILIWMLSNPMALIPTYLFVALSIMVFTGRLSLFEGCALIAAVAILASLYRIEKLLKERL